MALEAKDCGWLAIAMGEADQASDMCPADAEFFKQKADEFNVLGGNRCGQYPRSPVPGLRCRRGFGQQLDEKGRC